MLGMHRGRSASAFAVTLVLLMGAVFQCSAAAAQVTLSAAKDNTLYEFPDGLFSNGAGDHFFAGRANQTKYSIRRGLIAFDIAGSIPAGSTITSATLTLYMSRTTAGPFDVALHRVTADWGEGATDASGQEGFGANTLPGDVSWKHTFYDDQFWANEGGDFLAPQSANLTVALNGFYSWTGPGLVTDVQYWLDHSGSQFGWILIGDESTMRTAKRFDSRTHPTENRRPRLVVEYTPPTLGACCLPGDECNVLTATDCATSSGEYLGDGTNCEGEACVSACPPDFTDPTGGGPDGVIDVFDLFVVLSNWSTDGPGADLAEPTNIVDVFDLFVLLSAWGPCP